LLAPLPTPKLEVHPSSAVRDCLFNLFAATLLIGGRSSIRNLRTRHAVVTGTHYMDSWKTTKNNIGSLTDAPSSLFASCFVSPSVCTNIKPLSGFFILFYFNEFHNKLSSPLNCQLNRIIIATTLYKERHKFIQPRTFPSVLTVHSFSGPSSAF
jgi:hypothetical protein